MAGFVEAARIRHKLNRHRNPTPQYQPGKPLKLLLAGYSGTRNTGADVRVEEMIRQFRHLLGDDHAELSILTIDPKQSRNYFATARQHTLPKIFPRFLFDTVHHQHGVVTCEGSMFKSRFANALSTMMVGSLGLAAAENKLAIGYGGEAGAMDANLERLVKRYCADSFILTRNEASTQILGGLGIQAESGTDTAWTFEPAPAANARRLLEQHGWDGHTPILALCPINPFWWPVKPDLGRTATMALGKVLNPQKQDPSHYASVYFHADGTSIRQKQQRYIESIANAVREFRSKTPVFPILVGMEALDRRACNALQDALDPKGDSTTPSTPMFVADTHDMFTLVSILRQSSYVVSSRYHAMVTSMPGLVPSIGITMDERIKNLMDDRGEPQWCLNVDDPELADHLLQALQQVQEQQEQTKERIRESVLRNLERMGRMGMRFVDHIRDTHPEFPLNPTFGSHGDPLKHLPSLSADCRHLMN